MIEYFQQREGHSSESIIEEFMLYFQYFLKTEKNQISEDKSKLNSEKIHFYKEQ